MLRRGRRVSAVLPIMTACLLVVATCHFGRVDNSTASQVAVDASSHEGHFTIDFSGYPGGSVEKWLSTRGFTFEKDAKNRKLLELSITNERLQLVANGRLTGFIFNDSVNVRNAGRIRIEWGVNRYPQEASYEKSVNNEALMLYIFFGKEKLSSGHFLIPDSPYFIGLFLCQDEQVNFPYKGRYFHAGGRFVCLGKPAPGEQVASDFDLARAFKNYFGKQKPSISGIGFGIDTSKAGGGGKGSAFIKSVEFFEDAKKSQG